MVYAGHTTHKNGDFGDGLWFFNHINLDCDFNRNIMEYLLISEDFVFL